MGPGANKVRLGPLRLSHPSCRHEETKMTHPTVAASSETYPFKLPPLPYAAEALAPVISANTLGFHHGKHHQAYVTNLNGLVEKDDQLKSKTMVEIIKATAGNPDKAGV